MVKKESSRIGLKEEVVRNRKNRPFPNYAPLPTNRNIKSRPSAKSTANV